MATKNEDSARDAGAKDAPAHNDDFDDRDALFAAIAAVATPDEARRFLTDLATPSEIRALAERWRIARMLDQGGNSYREISAVTGASTTTVVRVSRFLNDEPHRGYRFMLDRLNKSPTKEN
ncbi:MAG: YerC/YecD family TrpR-related protein [Parvularculaceae bacterium]